MVTGLRFTLVLCLLFCVVSISEAEAPKVYDIDLPAQGVAESLNELSEQTGVPVIFPYDLVKDRKAKPVVGRYTVLDALDVLLKETGLSGGLSEKGVLVVSSATSGAPKTGEIFVTHDDRKQNTNNTGAGQRTAIAAFFASIATAFTASADEAPDAGSGPSKMEYVVVTAEKHEERLKDTPVSVTVLEPDTLAENGQNRLIDYFATVPGLSVSSNAYYGGTQYLTIRGLSTGRDQNPTVATVIDDVPTGSSLALAEGMLTSPDLDPSDLARIEVLKGPQGTLYGSDSLGGLIKYVTVDPSTRGYSAHVEATGMDVLDGGLGYAVRGAANIPISDTVAIRTSAFARRDPGYIDDLTTGQTNVNSADVYGGHFSLLYRPSDDLSVKLNALIQDTHGNGSSVTDSNQLGQFTLGDLKQTGLPGTGLYRTQWELYSATVKARIADVDLVSVTGYTSNWYTNWTDFTGNSYISGTADKYYSVSGAAERNHYRTDKISQELRLSSSIGHWLDWLVGGFYTHERSPGSSQTLDAAGLTTGAVAGPLFVASYSPLTFSEYAAFGALTFHMTDRFDVQVGGRESWNKTQYESAYTGVAIEDFFGVPSPDVQPTGHASGNAFTYLVTPKFAISPDVMVYARVASGYRNGGPNLVTGEGLAQGIPTDYKPDRTTNYEVGIKGDLLEHRFSFDAAAYYISWKNFQISVLNPSNFGYETNAGGAKSEGVELSVKVRPAYGLTITAEGSFDDAELTQDIPSNGAGIYGLSGDRLPYSIRFSGGLSVNQDVRLWNEWVGFLGGSVNYIGSRLWEFTSNAQQPRLNLPAYTTATLHAGARHDTWSINVFVNNVGNRRGVVGILPVPALGTPGYYTTVVQPRTVGITVARSF
jgi:outer membrane receptor protein involved in Fe transport